jgi:hypothetical protein
MDRLRYVRQIERRDPRLGRHVHHDSMSRLYPFRAPAKLDLKPTVHPRHVSVFDQGNLGSCVPNAGVGCLGTGAFYDLVRSRFAWTEATCQNYYRKVTRADPYPDAWEPTDTGSDGLSMAKVFTADTLINGYQHAFSLTDALAALMLYPIITGTNWYRSMFDPSPSGEVTISAGSPIDGGHEYVADTLDPDNERVGFTNSWSPDWGNGGRFWMSFATWERLLAEEGDVTVFTPLDTVPPTPVPVPGDVDRVLATVTRDWAAARHVGANAAAARAVNTWRKAKGL